MADVAAEKDKSERQATTSTRRIAGHFSFELTRKQVNPQLNLNSKKFVLSLVLEKAYYWRARFAVLVSQVRHVRFAVFRVMKVLRSGGQTLT